MVPILPSLQLSSASETQDGASSLSSAQQKPVVLSHFLADVVLA